jgi:poly(A) polymerase Pap1
MEMDFFGSFVTLLSDHSDFTAVRPIKKTIAPIIKLEYGKLNMDLAFCSTTFDTAIIDTDFETAITDDKLLMGMEETMIRAFNAWRNAQLLLKSIRLIFFFYGQIFGFFLATGNLYRPL